MKNNRVLIIAAHPDDEILGCGGTIAKLVGEGCEAYTLILGRGAASRYKIKDRKKIKKATEELEKCAYKANNLIGVKKLYIYNFPDNRFDTVSLLDIVKLIEGIKKKIEPNIIFTHYEKDLNIDHQITYKAVITATRPLSSETVKEIYSFEVPSSTEWNYPLTFLPNLFFDISGYIDVKLEAFKKYKSEINKYPHPRSLKGIQNTTQFWGMNIGVAHAEAFEVIRVTR